MSAERVDDKFLEEARKHVREADIPGLFIIERPVFPDGRGEFSERWRYGELEAVVGREIEFRQGNESRTRPGALRGLHAEPWVKLVWCTSGEVFVAVVDLRPDSVTFGQHQTFTLQGIDNTSLFVSEGLAHGFLALRGGEDGLAHYSYDVTKEYRPGNYLALMWSDPDVGINWPIVDPLLSEKDRKNPALRELFPERFK